MSTMTMTMPEATATNTEIREIRVDPAIAEHFETLTGSGHLFEAMLDATRVVAPGHLAPAEMRQVAQSLLDALDVPANVSRRRVHHLWATGELVPDSGALRLVWRDEQQRRVEARTPGAIPVTVVEL